MRTEHLVADWLIERIAAATDVDPGTIHEDVPFRELGLSSIRAVELSDDLARWTGVELSPTVAFEHPTIGAVAAHVAEEVERCGLTLAR
jgi:acyl carrier protein